MQLEDLSELNPYAVTGRCADDRRELQMDDAKRALLVASKVRAAVRELIPPTAVR